MAEGKKGIIVYADWIDKFEALEDAEAGVLIKHFFRYVNDLNPEYPDRTTKLMFIDIKNTLNRDLEKWVDKSPQRIDKARVAGLASAEARKLKKQLNPTNELKVQLNPTKSTVSVSVSDSVSESVTKEETHPLKNSNLYRQPIIPTKHEVWEVFKSSGGTQEMAKSFYDKYEVTNWFLNNSPITNWRTLSQRFIGNWQKIEDRKPTYQIQSTAPPLKRVS